MQRILLVDDERGITFAMSSYLRRRGFDVDCAGDAESARLLMSQRAYALAILDIHLAGCADCDGLDLAESIRRDSPQTPVIVLTALDTPEATARAEAAGARFLIRKPVRMAHVAEVASGLLRPVAVSV